MAPSNVAAWLPSPRARPLKVDNAEYPTVGDNEIVVKVSAVALNPMDWLIQVLGENLFSWLQYPYIGGTDAAGTVVEVGGSVTKYKVGDRVVGLAAGFTPREGAFQDYVVLRANASAPIPDNLSFEDAVVLPLGLCTAYCGLYQKDYLALEYPRVDPKPAGRTVLIWAGASSVGSNAIQLAVASGYEVFTTASPQNWDYCKALGASRVFDYRSPTVVQDLVDAFQGKTCAGGFAIHPGSEQPVFEVVARSEGAKTVAVAGPLPKDIPAGITAKGIFAGTEDDELRGKIWNDFLPEALAQSKYKCQPAPRVVGQGLDKIQEGLDLGAQGVSAQKLVVKL
ncbi:01115b18-6811-4f7b-83d0-2e876b7043d9 [Thermothielavioides terrestris]|uniref:01115b18-6811-4f7b-83d0-2e876b7043d9 n=1 Tax=Thermothielavioides terrestris TaxID=2587410 RepID=A0A3S4C791_9PEZI|nr:01115b18-6811-4f7b-83d0-2e876b7043d9 [Thermothielavioides terrestris]